MAYRLRSTLAIIVLCVPLAVPAGADPCGPPRFAVRELVVGDGSFERGWIAGVSLADVDGDGDLDLMATHGYDTTSRTPASVRPDRSMLYRNDGRGGFARVVDSALSNAATWASGSTFGDVDGDGDLDAFVSTERGQVDAFYRNVGDGRFVREELGDATRTPGSNFTSTWVDVDGDGDLDLTVGGPTLEEAGPNLDYRNDGGVFVRVEGGPLDNAGSNPGTVLWGDLDGDGDQDAVITNTDISRRSGAPPAAVEVPVVLRNLGGWRFERVGPQGFDAPEFSASTAALGDVDGDGDLDLFLGGYTLANRPVRDRLLRNDGSGRFREEPSFQPAPHADFATGAAFADLDGDGDLDLVTVAYGGGIEVYRNDGRGRLALLEDASLLGRRASHSAVAAGDLDGDGDVDLVFGNWGEANPAGQFPLLAINEGPGCGTWLDLRLFDRHGAPDPPGARVMLTTLAQDGALVQRTREASAQTSFRSQGASFFLFGLPPGEKPVEAEVRWPSGDRQLVHGLGPNARVEVRQGSPQP